MPPAPLNLPSSLRGRVRDRALLAICDKVEAGERLGSEDGLTLFGTSDLLALGALANAVREAKNGDRAFFNLNRHINPTDFCISGCSFCAFAKKPGDPSGHRMTPAEVELLARPGLGGRFDEIHMVGGLDPELPLEKALDLLRAAKRANPEAHLKAFTLVEVDYYAKTEGMTPQAVLSAMREAGLDSMPGGGAEILGEELRRKICPGKISGRRWLDLARIAHGMGIRTNCTMLYGHLESPADRVEHILQLRGLQDETAGFMAFIPLHFQKANTPYEHLHEATGVDDLRTLAASRLLFDNVGHIKVYWVMVGTKIAQTALWFGADDMDGTVVEERIGHDAGAPSPRGLPVDELVRLIRAAGRVPVERDSLYGIRKIWD